MWIQIGCWGLGLLAGAVVAGRAAAPATLGLLALPRVGHLGGALSFGVVTLAAVTISLALQPASRAWAELP